MKPGGGVPIGECAHRNLTPDGWRPIATLSWTRGACWCQQSVNRSRAHAQELATNYLVQLEVAMMLQGSDQEGQEWPEPLAADPIGGLPEHDQGLAHGLVVKTRPSAGVWLFGQSLALKYP